MVNIVSVWFDALVMHPFMRRQVGLLVDHYHCVHSYRSEIVKRVESKVSKKAQRDLFNLETDSKMTIIDKLMKAKILPPPTEDVIFKRHTPRYNRLDASTDESDDSDDDDSDDSDDEDDEDETTSDDSAAHRHAGWHAPFQILWDTPPTHNRTKTEMVRLFYNACLHTQITY